jgi:AAA+ ATPase superfamily predicted ATPase
MGLINRKTELAVLAAALDDPPALFVLYGRRRVGKTALLREVCRGRRHVFMTADLGTTQDHLRSFGGCLARDLGEPEWENLTLPGWEEALRLCLRRAEEEPLVLVLDEFQHLVTAEPALATILQRLWDRDVQGSKLSIVLCGSYVSFMEREVLGVRNPLYGRRTGQLRLRLLEARHAGLFFPRWTAEERMTAVGILGGVPAYLRLFREDRDLETNVARTILEPGAPLLEEPRFLMMEEVRDPQAYFSVCRAMAHGRHTPNEIANASGLPYSGMAHLLSTLRGLSLVERRVPATIRNPERTRRSLYRLQDDFVRFWFRFVWPNRTTLEAGDAALVWKRKIAPHLAEHVAFAFEDAAAELLRQANRRGNLPAEYDRIGPWWHGPEEVDAVAVADDGPLLLAECKWSKKPVDLDVLERLVAKTAVVSKDLANPPTRVDYALFSRSGFSERLREEAESRGVLLFTVDDVLGLGSEVEE